MFFKRRELKSSSRKPSASGSSRRRGKRLFALQAQENRRVMSAAVLNEISVNPDGGDQPWEFVEIKGVPNSLITDLDLVSLEGDNAAQGIADLVFDLRGVSFGSNGLIVLAPARAVIRLRKKRRSFVQRHSRSVAVKPLKTERIHSP